MLRRTTRSLRVCKMLRGLASRVCGVGSETLIPRILHRVVPSRTTDQVEAYWGAFANLHPQWELRTWRDPLDPNDFPRLGRLFGLCTTGAGLADLVRLDVLWVYGGIYVDSDCEPVRPLDPLLGLGFFIGQQQWGICTNAVMGSEPCHPALDAYIRRICASAPAALATARPDVVSGPLAATKALLLRRDVALLPPEAFYAEPWEATMNSARLSAEELSTAQTYVIHRWAGSWLPALSPYRRARRAARRFLKVPILRRLGRMRAH